MDSELALLARFLTGSSLPASEVPWRLLRAQDIAVVREWARETMAPDSQQRVLLALRAAIVAFGPRSSVGEVEPHPDPELLATPPIVRAPRRRRPIRGAGASRRTATLLLEACAADERPEGRRDAALAGLMLFAGLQRSEVARLRRDDYDDGRLEVLHPRGVSRLITLNGEPQELLEAWLAQRGSGAGAMFAPIEAGGGVHWRALSPSAVGAIVGRRALAAGCVGLRPGDLRRAFQRRLSAPSADGWQASCRYVQLEEGQPAWWLPSLPGL